MGAALVSARRRPGLAAPCPIDAAAARRALAGCSPADALAEIEEDYRALEVRRAEREPRAIGLRVQPQCPGCRKFVQSLARECSSCGYFGAAGYPG